jgi:hypothetical protein
MRTAPSPDRTQTTAGARSSAPRSHLLNTGGTGRDGTQAVATRVSRPGRFVDREALLGAAGVPYPGGRPTAVGASAAAASSVHGPSLSRRPQEERAIRNRQVPDGSPRLAARGAHCRVVSGFRVITSAALGPIRGDRLNTDSDLSPRSADSLALWALGSAALGVVSVIVIYWAIVPAVLFGLVAVIVGIMARQRAERGGRARDIAIVAVCLGAVAMLFTPVVLMHTHAAEDWGRDCALRPEHDENCPRGSP